MAAYNFPHMPRTALLLASVLFLLAWSPPPPKVQITDVLPSLGRPEGGEWIAIAGRGFRAPARVFFDVGAEWPVEGFVASVSDQRIEAITPAILLDEGQQYRVAEIFVEVDGTRVKAPRTFLYEKRILQPSILASVPSGGRAGTVVSIFGEAFQPPVQVLFGNREGRVYRVDRDRIVVEAPVMPQPCAQNVAVTVRNILSGTSFTLPDAFRYAASPRCGAPRRGIIKPPRAESAASAAEASTVTRNARTND